MILVCRLAVMDLEYWVGATRALRREARRRGLREIISSGLRAEAERAARSETDRAASAEHILALYPELEDTKVPVGDVQLTWSNMPPAAIYALTAIIRLRRPSRIFEIGTYDGATTLHMAAAAPSAEIWTLDLPESESDLGYYAAREGVTSKGVGHRFRGTTDGRRITQLYGDSRAFDFTRWHGTIDLVVVDAGHTYDLALADSLTAFRLLRPGGVIIWDDYCPPWPGVIRAVDEVVAAEPSRRAVRIEGTNMAVIDPAMHWPPKSPPWIE